jgi:hypothetical protein
MSGETRIPLLGCGILARELEFLIRKNAWPIATDFLPSSLHVDFRALEEQLKAGLGRYPAEKPIVFYGRCHPRMDVMLQAAGTFRVGGQNCLDMLLGPELFMEQLEAGAFFLLEEWALNWESVIVKTFGGNWKAIRAIFHDDRKFLLGVRTPCSNDFSQAAERAAALVDLPLRWMDTDLAHLERVIEASLRRRLKAQATDASHAGPEPAQGSPLT